MLYAQKLHTCVHVYITKTHILWPMRHNIVPGHQISEVRLAAYPHDVYFSVPRQTVRCVHSTYHLMCAEILYKDSTSQGRKPDKGCSKEFVYRRSANRVVSSTHTVSICVHQAGTCHMQDYLLQRNNLAARQTATFLTKDVTRGRNKVFSCHRLLVTV